MASPNQQHRPQTIIRHATRTWCAPGLGLVIALAWSLPAAVNEAQGQTSGAAPRGPAASPAPSPSAPIGATPIPRTVTPAPRRGATSANPSTMPLPRGTANPNPVATPLPPGAANPNPTATPLPPGAANPNPIAVPLPAGTASPNPLAPHALPAPGTAVTPNATNAIDSLTAAQAAAGNLGLVIDSEGSLRVANVTANQLGAAPVLQPNDQILAVNGTTVATPQQFINQLTVGLPTTGVARIEIGRSGRRQTVDVDVLGLSTGLRFANPRTDQPGVVRLGAVTPGSIAASAGLLVGDELVSINGRPVTSLRNARGILISPPVAADRFTLHVRRDGMMRTVELPAWTGLMDDQAAVAGPEIARGLVSRSDVRQYREARQSRITAATRTLTSLEQELRSAAKNHAGPARQDIEEIRSQLGRLEAELNRMSSNRMDDLETSRSKAQTLVASIQDRLRWIRLGQSGRQEAAQLESMVNHLRGQIDAI